MTQKGEVNEQALAKYSEEVVSLTKSGGALVNLQCKDFTWRYFDDKFLNEYRELFERYAGATGVSPDREAVPVVEMRERAVVGGALDLRAAIATALVLFSLCFTCVYLMPSLTCEERERGLLLAQALSPATAAEILAAKFLFYPAFGILLATLLAGIHNPVVLGRPFFWMSLATLSVGLMIGRTYILGDQVRVPSGPGTWKVTMVVEGTGILNFGFSTSKRSSPILMSARRPWGKGFSGAAWR